MAKQKQYVSDNARLMAEWDWEKNTDCSPQNVSLGSERKVWWKCSKEHSWQANAYNRYKNNSGCPYCSHLLAVPGQNDFATKHPKIAEEWHPIKNADLNPNNILPSSNKKVWWLCKQRHEWQASVYNRCKNGSDCPYCSGREVLSGSNDLQTVFPHLAEEWNFEKNAPLLPSQLTSKSNKRVWWKCKRCGYEWQAAPNNRAANSHFTGCPKCTKEAHTSFPEQAIYYFISKHYADAVNGFSSDFLGRMELDIFIPSLKIAIEYDGAAWHSTNVVKKREQAKYSSCRENEIYLIRIREEAGNNTTEDCDLVISSRKNAAIEDIRKVLKELSLIIPMKDDFDIMSAEPQIRSNYLGRTKEKSLANLYPDIAQYWNYDRNQEITPDNVTSNSNFSAWWKCKHGHEWRALVSNMVRNHAKHKNQSTNGCPYCSGKKVIPGETDLKTLSPMLSEQWNYERNNDLCPETFSAHSNKKVWWRCHLGHEWVTTINSRYSGGYGCPYCADRRILPGYNDLATRCPHLIEEWNFSKNAQIDPTKIGSKSKEKVWWKCTFCGHEWLTSVAVRTRGSKCPNCSKSKK